MYGVLIMYMLPSALVTRPPTYYIVNRKKRRIEEKLPKFSFEALQIVNRRLNVATGRQIALLTAGGGRGSVTAGKGDATIVIVSIHKSTYRLRGGGLVHSGREFSKG